MDKTGKVMTEKNITMTIPENNLPTKFRVKCTVRKQFEINYMGRDDSQLHKHNRLKIGIYICFYRFIKH